MKANLVIIFFIVLPSLVLAQNTIKQFAKITAQYSQIDFVNTIDQFASPGIMEYSYYYNGAGVAAGDINNDGLIDLYFSSNKGQDKLYLNQGNLQFKDISLALGTQDSLSWKTGVTMADINGDGYLDIYVSCSGFTPQTIRKNKLYINNRNLSFTEAAQKFGIDDPGYSTQATFFDYDRDGDVDLYVVNAGINPSFNIDVNKSQIDKYVGDKLYRNNDGRFVDVTQQAGISQNGISLGLGVVASDINNDGWCDLYVANDFLEHDYIFINNKNGTFTESSSSMLGHIPMLSMGCDIADFNNDGLVDIVTLDMLPESLERQKLFLTPDNYEKFSMEVKNGYQYQYMRNMLQLNNGDGTFSEIGQLAGVSNTDWSWSSLFADFNNDGYKDLLVTNGFLRDINNNDYIKYSISALNGKTNSKQEYSKIIKNAPSTKVSNYIFENNKNLTFSNKSIEWGIDDLNFSNAAVYSDLDNDGDLDIVICNINEMVTMYKNQAEMVDKNKWIQCQLNGAGVNTKGSGAKVYVFIKGKMQLIENTATRGFQSSISDVVHFGLGKATMVDSIKVVWSSGKIDIKKRIKINQRICFFEQDGVTVQSSPAATIPLFTAVKPALGFKHLEGDDNDFKRQYLLNTMLSKIGPRFKSADINKDGLIDFFAFGSIGSYGTIFLGNIDNNFNQFPLSLTPTGSRISSAEFFDSDNDGDLDLYLAMGGYSDFTQNDDRLQDLLFLNDGKGKFCPLPNGLPSLKTSKSCVSVLDFNADGYQDLFVGGRVVPGAYPNTPESYLLLNDGNGHFTNVIDSVCSGLRKSGMITDAVIVDINDDKKQDLITVGEWMNIEVWEGNGKELINRTSQYFNKSYKGWWNTINVEDIDGDGDLDVIAGNLGLNSQIKTSRDNPIQLLFADFDGNQAVDPFLCFSSKGKTYPFNIREELLDQIFNKRRKFTSYSSYAAATIQDVFSNEELAKAQTLIADHFKTTLFINENGKFKEMELPMQAQVAPVYKIVIIDVNKDNKKDILLLGNESNFKLRLGKSDANYGVLMINNGNKFEYVPQYKSGLCIKGDVKDAWYDKNSNRLNVGLNGGMLQTYQLNY